MGNLQLTHISKFTSWDGCHIYFIFIYA